MTRKINKQYTKRQTGAPKKMIVFMSDGVILAMGRIFGETAALSLPKRRLQALW